jgi:Tfp pilus assembly protein PilF
MKKDVRLLAGLAVGLAVAPLQMPAAAAHPLTGQITVLSAAAQGRNAIYGRVFGPTGRPVADVFIELLDEVNSTIGRAKTDTSGTFTFGGLSNGRFRLRVMPFGTDYLETVQEVTLYSVSAVQGSGADRQQVDIQLRYNERANAGPFAIGPAVVFSQEVPAAAKKLYEEGVNFMREKKEKEGFESLRKALEIFPDYYLALDRLGSEYATRGNTNRSFYEAGSLLLAKAAQINPRAYTTAFGLGWTQYHLGQTDQAVENLQRATTLYGKSPDAYLWLGKALRRASKLDQAEQALRRANELGSGKVADVHWQLAAVLSDQKRYREAADELELFLKAQPDTADAEKIRGVIKQLRDKAAGGAK